MKIMMMMMLEKSSIHFHESNVKLESETNGWNTSPRKS